MEEARRYILKTSILVVWAISGGIQHFLCSFGHKRKILNMWHNIVIDQL